MELGLSARPLACPEQVAPDPKRSQNEDLMTAEAGSALSAGPTGVSCLGPLLVRDHWICLGLTWDLYIYDTYVCVCIYIYINMCICKLQSILWIVGPYYGWK